MQLRVRLDRQLRNVCLIFRVLWLVAEPLALHPWTAWTPLDSLDAPAPCAWTPLKLVLLNVLDLCVFMPDPRLLDPVSPFLTDERSDAAVVGSGNKAMRSRLCLPLEAALNAKQPKIMGHYTPK